MKFRIGSHNYYENGALHEAGAEVSLPPGAEPSRTWTPLDKEGEVALAKLRRGDVERERLHSAKGSEVKPEDLEAIIERKAAAIAEAAIAKFVAGQKGEGGKAEAHPAEAHRGRAADKSPV